MSSDASVLPDIDYPLIVLVSLKSLYHLLYDKIDGRHFTLKRIVRKKELKMARYIYPNTSLEPDVVIFYLDESCMPFNF